MDPEQIKQWMKNYTEAIETNKEKLGELDTKIGDGDHGNNMSRGMQAVSEAIADKDFATDTDAYKTIAMTLLSKVGGASGPLYGTAFIEMGKAAKNDAPLADQVQAAADGIAKRGGAQAGDKTMLDVWLPIANALKNNDLTESVINDAVNATQDMEAKKGRASYLGERSIGTIDPGALSTGLLFQSLLKAGVNNG